MTFFCVRVADFDRTRLAVVGAPPTLRAIGNRERANRLLRQGDLWIEKSGGGYNQPVGCVVGFDHTFDAVCSNFIGRITVAPGMWPRYWTYVHASLYSSRLNVPAIKQTTGIQNLDTSAYFDQRVPFPPLARQRAIADYLDRETARLDALVAEKERVLELLAEKRRALITCAVTRGLDPRAPLRDSGVPWLGKIPSHWSRMQLRRFTNFITSGSRGWAEHYSDSGSFFLRIGNLTRNSIQLDLADAQYVDPPEGSEGERTRIQPGDLLFSITAYLGSIAVAPVGFENAYVSQHIALVRLTREKGLDPVYAGYTSLSEIGQSQLTGLGYGGTKTQLALDDIRELWFPVPPLPEQMAIVRRLERETSILDGLYSATTRTLALLRERRDSLIAAAVTGLLQVA